MFCPECGRGSADGCKFCGYCGTSFTADEKLAGDLTSEQPVETTADPEASASLPPMFRPPDHGTVTPAFGDTIQPVQNVRPDTPSSDFLKGVFARAANNKMTIALIASVLTLLIGIPATWYFLTANTHLATDYESVPFGVSTSTDDNLLTGVKFTRTPGKNGSRQIKTKIWLGERDRETDRKVVSDRIVLMPEDEVVVEGIRSQNDVAKDVSGIASSYMDSWKKADYSALVNISSTDSLKNYSQENIEQAYAATGEILEGFTVGTPKIMKMEDLITAADSQTGSSSSYGSSSSSSGTSSGTTDTLTEADYPFGSLVVAQVPVTYTTNSRAVGRITHSEQMRLAFIGGSWRVLYTGMLAAIPVNRTERVVSKGYGEDDLKDVALNLVIVYPDHTVLVVQEANVTHSKYGNDSMSSHFSNLPSSYGYGSNEDRLMIDDSTAGLEYIADEKKSTPFSTSVKEGTTQSGYIYVTPGLPAEAKAVSVEFRSGYSSSQNVFFNGIAIR
ncbi:MAG: G5 domain-containing protein [Thermoleophilia bacterium]|jgi:hypothetical protein